MKKNNGMTGMFSLLLAFTLVLTGCPTGGGDGGGDRGPVKYTVTFDANGGLPQTQTVEAEQGKTAALPPAPAKTDGPAVFQGWYTENGNGGNWGYRFTQASPVTANITVYAKWGTEAPSECAVTFDADGGTAFTENSYTS